MQTMQATLDSLATQARQLVPAPWMARFRVVERRTNSVALCGLIVALAYILFFQARLVGLGGDPSRFIVAGQTFVNASLAPRNIVILPIGGYDGQQYYRLALNPFTTQQDQYGVHLDKPSYRQQRILYPLIVWAVTLGGHARLIPLAMILVNLLALIALGFLAALLAQQLGRHALWGLLVALYPGFVLSLSRDLPEPIAAMFLVASMLFALRRQFPLATVLLALAVLTRETTLLLAVAALLIWLAGLALPSLRARMRIPWYYPVIPLAIFALWQGVLYLIWHRIPIVAGGNDELGVPLGGFATLLGRVAQLGSPENKATYLELIFLLIVGAAVVVAFRASHTPPFIKVAWLLALTLASVLTTAIWVEDWAFFRALTEYYVAGSAVLLGGRWWARAPVLVMAGGLWLYLATHRNTIL
jgi:hypothetical protein